MTRPALVLVALLGAALSAQETAPVIDRLVDKANHQNPYLSAQGLKALKTQGDAAIPAIERFVSKRSVHALAPLVVEWLGEVADERARVVLKSALAVPSFSWRPQATRALARSPRGSEIDLFLGAAKDVLPAVREAALLALGDLAAKEPALRPRAVAGLEAGMLDPLFEPRLAAAEALLKLGEKSPLPVLVEALGVERRFFDLDFGVLARRRAWAALEPLVGQGISYDPSAGGAKNASAIEEISRRLHARPANGLPTSRPRAPLAGDLDDAIFGVEIRSCRAGDQWVRLTAGGDLVLGHYDLVRRKLAEPHAREIKRLLKDAASPEAAESRLEPGAFFGRPGCDFERWYLPDETALVRLTVGLAGRPEKLAALHVALAGAVESAFGAAAGQELQDRTMPFAKPDAGED